VERSAETTRDDPDGKYLKRNRWFESGSLQQRVCCEPDFLDQGAGDGPSISTLSSFPVGSWFGAQKSRFTASHRDVVPTLVEGDEGAAASFALPNRPFNDYPGSLDQRFVVTVEAAQYGVPRDDLVYATPFLPTMNEFYGKHSTYGLYDDKARAEPGRLGRGALGIIASVRGQLLQIPAIRVYQWMRALFGRAGMAVERSEPGLRCSSLIRQLGGIDGCRVLKITGVRDLIGRYGPDQSFTRSAGEKYIGRFDETTGRMQFDAFADLYIQARDNGKLTPGEVLRFLTSRGVFRVGLDFECTNCQLTSWVHLDEIKTMSRCIYCGHAFDVTPQLKDRDWRYRRSGLFGRDDHQLGGVPVALAIQQLHVTLDEKLLMYSTALEFRPAGARIEHCEADFIAVAAGNAFLREAPVQILLGEAKGHRAFDADDVRKLGGLADAMPPELAEVFIMFAKTDAFTPDEVQLALTLNTRGRRRVILWSQDELEPYLVYERSETNLGRARYSTTLTGMAQITEQLWSVRAAGS
jgi:hypothetical protein